MKRVILSSATGCIIISVLNLIVWYYSSNNWWAFLIINSIVLLIITFLFTIYFKRKVEEDIVYNIYEKLKGIIPNHEHTKIIINKESLMLLIDEVYQERIKEQEKFKKLDSYRKEYLGNVSHELKTPLFNVQGYISTLLDGGYEDKDILIEYLTKADKNIERMQNIIDDLETISQLESGAMVLDYEVFDIENLINEVFEQMELSAQKKEIKFKLIKNTDEYYLVNADKFRIRQVLLNLISNSIKYGKEKGNTIVILKKENNKVFVTISDNGIGIEEKHLPRIFERFYRVDKGRSREQGGTGLGLAIVKHIIEAHKQTISVKSKPNEGTSFTFTLQGE